MCSRCGFSVRPVRTRVAEAQPELRPNNSVSPAALGAGGRRSAGPAGCLLLSYCAASFLQLPPSATSTLPFCRWQTAHLKSGTRKRKKEEKERKKKQQHRAGRWPVPPQVIPGNPVSWSKPGVRYDLERRQPIVLLLSLIPPVSACLLSAPPPPFAHHLFSSIPFSPPRISLLLSPSWSGAPPQSSLRTGQMVDTNYNLGRSKIVWGRKWNRNWGPKFSSTAAIFYINGNQPASHIENYKTNIFDFVYSR